MAKCKKITEDYIMQFNHTSKCINVTITLYTHEIKMLLDIFDRADLFKDSSMDEEEKRFMNDIIEKIYEVYPDNKQPEDEE